MRICLPVIWFLLVFAAAPVSGQEAAAPDTTGSGYRFFDRPVDADRYLIRPGDELRVTFVNAQISPMTLEVDPEGRVVDRTLGLMDLSGKTLSGARGLLGAELQKLFKVDTIVISITAPMRVGIQISGAVNEPGSYVMYTSQRVSELVDSAGGISSGGSRRRIVFSGGPEPVMVDLDRSTFLGEEAPNPALYAGYSVRVPSRLASVVDVVGEVGEPRQIEFLGGEDLAMLIKLAGGYRPTADSEHVKVIRGSRHIPADEAAVQAGDIVFVPPRGELTERAEVIVFGAVENPGRYPLEGYPSLANLLEAAGGFTDKAVPQGTAVFRLTPIVPDQKRARERYPIANIVKDDGTTPGFTLRSGDSVVVPVAVEYVRVSGEVRNPGLYPYESGQPASYYITAAGGFLPTADKDRVDIFLRVSQTTARYSPEVTVHDGDEVIVQRREELK